MKFKDKILKNYLHEKDIIHIIGHHSRRYIVVIVNYGTLLALLFLGFYSIDRYFEVNYVIELLFGILGILLYIIFIIKFLDIHLDGLVLTSGGLIIFRREGLLQQKSENIQWESTQSIYDEQNGIFDVILNKGKIKIKRQNEVYVFDEVGAPSKVADIIIDTRDKILSNELEKQNEPDKFDMLVETLGDVIREYMNKDNR